MAAEYLTTWSPAAIIAAHTALLGLLDSDTNPAYVTVHDSTDTLLATITLQDPCGTVNPTTGALTLHPDGREESAPASGDASYITVRDGAGSAHRSLPCQVGTSGVVGKCVLNSVAILAGTPVELVSVVVG